MITMDGYEDCLVGVVERFGHPDILCYDKDMVIEKLMSDGMSDEEAVEWFEYNQLGSYVGPTTPCFITRMSFDCLSIEDVI